MIPLETRRHTLEEFLALPQGPPHFEFEEGEIVSVPSPTADHQDIVYELLFALRQYVRSHRAGRAFRGVDIFLPDGRVLLPDGGFIATENRDALGSDGKIHGVPDLVIEVASQDALRDRVHKANVYYANRIPWYWIVDQATLTIEEFERTPEGYRLAGQTQTGETFRPGLFPSLEINLAELLGVEESEAE